MIQTNKEWNGYSLDELRFRRMLSLAKFELGKASLVSQVQAMTKSRAAAGSIFAKLTGALNYADYAILAFRFGKNLLRVFRRRR